MCLCKNKANKQKKKKKKERKNTKQSKKLSECLNLSEITLSRDKKGSKRPKLSILAV